MNSLKYFSFLSLSGHSVLQNKQRARIDRTIKINQDKTAMSSHLSTFGPSNSNDDDVIDS